MKPVGLNIDNTTKCLCPVCPVQTESPCVRQKREEGWDDLRASVVGGILEEYADHPESYEMPIEELRDHPVGREHGAGRLSEEAMIELYCSIGKSICPDLVTSKSCVCPDCSVWRSHELGSRYYCLSGSARSSEGEQT